MAHYYYPLSTIDFAFENIFSSESISPASYYDKRAFGFDYFPLLKGLHSEHAIILYSAPPEYKGVNDAKFILKIDDAIINSDDLFFISEGIFAYYGTIYFAKKYFSILFFSGKDLKVSLLKANTSLPTKVTEKYRSSFYLIEESDCVAFPVIDTSKIMLDDRMAEKILLDKRYNQFKGFIYGLVIGKIANDRKREFGLKLRFQEITNAFAELKSRLDDYNSIKYKDEASRIYRPFVEKLFQALQIAENEYHQLNLNNTIDENALMEYLLTKQSRLKSKSDITKYLDYIVVNDELLGRSDYKKIVDAFTRDHAPSVLVFQQLRNHFEQFIHAFQSVERPVYLLEELNNKIKAILRNSIETHLEELSNRAYILTTDLRGIFYNFITNEVMPNTGHIYLNTKADNEFTFIVNAILKFSKSNKGPAQKDMILKIVEEIGNGYTKHGRETLLYQYLENRIDVYSLDNASNLVMKNFVAFVFNPDSLEKLDDFLISKTVEERWMAFSFWGAYNGFANMSRNYTRNVFSSNNAKLQNYIDDYLKQYIPTIIATRPEISKSEDATKFQTLDASVANNLPEELVINLYNLHVAKHYNLSVDQLKEALKITEAKEFQNVLKSKYHITKKDSLKLFNIIKKYFDPNTLFH